MSNMTYYDIHPPPKKEYNLMHLAFFDARDVHPIPRGDWAGLGSLAHDQKNRSKILAR